MKKIAIATDFSENANDAARFGVELAKKTNAQVFFLHVYSLPIQNAEFPEMIDFTAYESIKQKQLKKVVGSYDVKDISYENHTLCGYSMFEQMESFCTEKNIDLVVMGLTGASRISELFLGSNTLHMLTHTSIPVLAIPKAWKQHIEGIKMAFAYDNRPLTNKKNLNLLKEFSM